MKDLSFSRRVDVLTEKEIKELGIKITSELFTPASLAAKLYQRENPTEPFYTENANLKNVLLEEMAKGRVNYDNLIVEIDSNRFIYVSEARQKLPYFGFVKVLQKTGRKKKD